MDDERRRSKRAQGRQERVAFLPEKALSEMVLDRPLYFNETELNFSSGYQAPRVSTDGPAPQSNSKSNGPLPRRPFPF